MESGVSSPAIARFHARRLGPETVPEDWVERGVSSLAIARSLARRLGPETV